jgi:hypothetical protein
MIGVLARASVLGALAAIALAGCVKHEPYDYTAFKEENPRSVLVVPVMNNSPEVGADDYFLATISVPVAERGFYVFPVNLTRALLADAGLSDPGLVHEADPVKVAKLFGADSILFIKINNWEAQYLLLTTQVTVGFEYLLVSGKSGRTLWESSRTLVYTPDTVSTGNIIADVAVMAIQAAATKIAPNYIPLARQANWQAIAAVDTQTGQPMRNMGLHPFLYGPRHPLYKSDWQPQEGKAATGSSAAEPRGGARRRGSR